MKKLLVMAVMLPSVALAQEAQPDLLDKVSAALTSVEGMSAMIAVAIELVCQLVKTEKPKSLLLAAGVLIEKVAGLLKRLGMLLQRVSTGGSA